MSEPAPLTRRLFFALWPAPAMQAALSHAARSVLTASDGTPVPEKNFHLTLAFLGSVPVDRVPSLTPFAARVALAFQDSRPAPIDVTLDRIDYWRKSQILCATSRAEPHAAIALAEILKRVLIENGFAPDLKPFRAHATLARKVRRVTHDRDMREHDMPAVRWSFSEYHLVESRTAPSGSLYSTREIYPLDMRAR